MVKPSIKPVDDREATARRDFLKLCGKYAAAMPPAVTLLLSSAEVLATHTTDHQGTGPKCSKLPDPPQPPVPPCD